MLTALAEGSFAFTIKNKNKLYERQNKKHSKVAALYCYRMPVNCKRYIKIYKLSFFGAILYRNRVGSIFKNIWKRGNIIGGTVSVSPHNKDRFPVAHCIFWRRNSCWV